ncbi:hypothetical protein C8R43DRAFT_978099 [Mycena crocata]|nr:hypothetical protein C8R43DRAFT_978099 [Mycena crocata]
MHGSLRVNNFSRLPDPLKTLALSAADGSLSNLERLHDLIPDSPEAQLRLFIPAFYANLDSRDILGLRRQLETDVTGAQNRISKAVLALKGLSELQEHLVSRACSEVWSSAWKWIQFLDECVEGNKLHPLFLSTIVALSQDEDTATIIKVTLRVHVLIAKVWVAAVDDAQTPEPLWHDLCVFIIHQANPGEPKYLREFIEGAGGSIDNLASLIVKHIRRAIPDKTHTARNEDGFTLLAPFKLLEAVGIVDGPLTSALARQGIVKCMAAAVCALSRSSIPSAKQLIPLSIAVILAHISEFPGFPYVKEALDGGLLRAIVLSASRPDPILAVPLNYLLNTILPESLVYLLVLSSLRCALDDATEPSNDSDFRSSSFFRAWSSFVEVANERMEVMKQYETGELAAHRACDNLECDAILLEEALQRCAACRNAFYCSKACQTADWKAGGHRKLCGTSFNRHQEECTHLTHRDRGFMRALLHHDYAAMRGDILLRKIEYMRAHPSALPYVKFDYRQGRVAIEVGPAIAEGGTLQATRAARSGGRIELHHSGLRTGGCMSGWWRLRRRGRR